jgi:ABC-2 type transport system ATP-binding protein
VSGADPRGAGPTGADPPAIETTGLTRAFPSGVAVDDLTLEVRPGEVLALLGPNGAGKTTTVRLLNGVLRPDAGQARVLGLDPAVDGDEVRQRTGVLTEHAGLDDRLTAAENLVITARMRGMPAAAARSRTRDLLERFGMGDRADVIVQGFSTGQRKRVALARALLHDPEVLFLDEPTSGLDPSATRDVIELIGTLATEHRRTVVLCTHFLGEAGRLADRMAVLHRGRLHAFGRPEEIAAELWEGLDVDLDLGGAVDAGTAAAVRALPGVLAVAPTATGASVRVTGRPVVPTVVDAVVTGGRAVYAASPRPPTLEDVYFAVEARIANGEAGAVRGAPRGAGGEVLAGVRPGASA